MPLEVKMNFNKEALKKALKQIQGSMEFIDEWVAGDLTEECGWRYIPALCFESEISNFLGIEKIPSGYLLQISGFWRFEKTP